MAYEKLKKYLEKIEVFRYNSDIAFYVTTYIFSYISFYTLLHRSREEATDDNLRYF